MNTRISIIGHGFVGSAISNYFSNHKLYIYDKYKEEYPLNIELLMNTDYVFICVNTPYDEELCTYDQTALHESFDLLNQIGYEGTVIVKSTVEPNTTYNYSILYNKLYIIYNPEFLSARTAAEDYKNQSHIVIGCPQNSQNEIRNEQTVAFFKQCFPNVTEYTICNYTEAECIKIFCNTFYAVKIQTFNEFYLLCRKLNINYNSVIAGMLKNKWINPMHTMVPGTDGLLSYGGACLTKDTCALDSFCEKLNVTHDVINSTRNESKKIRNWNP
jgi:UDPglucose 6-dehydrogenase